MMGFVKTQDLADLLIKVLYLVAISLLSEASKIIKILPDLGCRHLHNVGKLLR